VFHEKLIKAKARAAPAVPALARLLAHDDIWLRVCAGDALAGIGEPARVALPEMLKEIERQWTVDEQTTNTMKPQLDKLREVIRAAENDKNPPKLISLNDLGEKNGT
jgi:hypothetical protein